MKKFITVFLSIIAVICCICMAACGADDGIVNGGNVIKPAPDDTDVTHTHAFGEWIVTKSAKCTEEGEQSRYCACGEVQTISIGVLGHDLQRHEGQAATCTKSGWVAYNTCTRCNYTTYEEISALGHDLQHHDGQAATETEDGWEEYETCSRCDYTNFKVIPALKHNIVEHSGKAAACTEDGYEPYVTCTDCDYTTFKAIPALGHDLQQHEGKVVTCTEHGWEEYDTCTRCDYTTYEEIPALGHDLQHHDGKVATCTEHGWVAYDTCMHCAYTTYEEIPALGHDLQHHEGKVATCTEAGWAAYETCTRCDYTTYKELPALGHDFTGEYLFDSTSHWHICLNGCGQTDKHENHSFGSDDSCTVCAFKITYTQNLAYTLSSDGSFYILSGIGDAIEKYIYVLPEVNGKPVREVATNAFTGNNDITELYLPESIMRIGAGAFENCSNLSKINVFDGYTAIGANAFAGTAYFNERTNWLDNILYIGANLISVRTTTLGVTKIKDGTTLIADGAYSGCANIIGLEIPESLKYIGENTFEGCTSIEEIVIPDTIESVEFLSGLSSLKKATIPAHIAAALPKTIQELTVTSGDIAEEVFISFTQIGRAHV